MKPETFIYIFIILLLILNILKLIDEKNSRKRYIAELKELYRLIDEKDKRLQEKEN